VAGRWVERSGLFFPEPESIESLCNANPHPSRRICLFVVRASRLPDQCFYSRLCIRSRWESSSRGLRTCFFVPRIGLLGRKQRLCKHSTWSPLLPLPGQAGGSKKMKESDSRRNSKLNGIARGANRNRYGERRGRDAGNVWDWSWKNEFACGSGRA
jgi:hypothetical protein